MKLFPDANKLALGTVQFGLDYGVANLRGQIKLQEIRDILELARTANIDTLDTAIGYGNSEEQLGQTGITQWNVVTKLPALPKSCTDVKSWVMKSVEQSLLRLQKKQIKGLLLHRPKDLLDGHGDTIYRALEQLKKDDLVQKIGVSIYAPEELDTIFANFDLDIIQAPFNILDRRLKESGWLSRLSQQGIEVHVRSVFLQGLLLMSPASRPDKFNRWHALWDTWHKWLLQSGNSPVQACLAHALAESEIDRVIIGVDGLEHLVEILQATTKKGPVIKQELSCNDIDLINPSRWNSL